MAPHWAVVFRIGIRLSSSDECSLQNPAARGRASCHGARGLRARAPVEGRDFRVDSGDSLLTIQVYKGGPLSRAGHNHVIASHSMKGFVSVPEDLMRASFEIHIPVDELVVDEEDLRVEAGPDFPPKVPEEARVGTKRNMLGAAPP